MDYPLQINSQLRQLLKSLRKTRQMTQAQLAQRLGVVQSRVADIEREPGSVSVEQLMNVLSVLGAQLVVRETDLSVSLGAPGHAPDDQAVARSDDAPGAPPRGQW